VKTRGFPYLVPLCLLFLTACDSKASRGPADVITFDRANRLDDFDFSASGTGRPGKWLVIDNDANRQLRVVQINCVPRSRPFGIPFAGLSAISAALTLGPHMGEHRSALVRWAGQ
jgi:hypothetical protein